MHFCLALCRSGIKLYTALAVNVVLKERWIVKGVCVILTFPGALFVLISVHTSFPACYQLIFYFGLFTVFSVQTL